MTRLGLTLSSEEHAPERLVAIAQRAEAAGFDFVAVSDHFHPWTREQGHAPFVWSVIGALSHATERIEVAVGVTCPIMRIHPAILAQAAATSARLLNGRFVWGLGSGEALNEQILGDRWPAPDVRLDRFTEAVQVIRTMLRGDTVTFRGAHFTVEDARIFDLPDDPIPLVLSAFQPQAARVAADLGDGLWFTGAQTDIAREYAAAGGRGPVYSQLSVCWAEDEDEATHIAHRRWPNTALPDPLAQELRTVELVEAAVSTVELDTIARRIPTGPDPAPYLAAAREAIEAGADHIYFHQIGDDQEGFVSFWERELREQLSGAFVG